MVRIRLATHADISALIELGRELHNESPRIRDFEFSEMRLWDVLDIAIDGGAVFVAESDWSESANGTKSSKIVGAILAMVTPHLSTEQVIGGELSFFVTKSARGSAAFHRLLRAAEEWAREQGAARMTLGLSTGIAVDSTEKLYQRMGYELSATSWSKDL